MRSWLVNGERVHEEEVWSSFGQIGLDGAGCRLWVRLCRCFCLETAASVSSASDHISTQRNTEAGPVAGRPGRGCNPTAARNEGPRVSIDAQSAGPEWPHVAV